MECGAVGLSALERGQITFVARPRIGGVPGLQSFAFVLDSGSRHLRIVVGKKRLPKPGSREREWAFVDCVADSHEDALGDLGPSTYLTKTRGLRQRPASRVIGEGRYAFVAHRTHTHLCYALDELDADDSVNVSEGGSMIVAVFNPVAKWKEEAVLRYGGDPHDPAPFAEPSHFDDELQSRFGSRRFLPLDLALLDQRGTELVLVGAERELRPELAALL